MEARKSHPNIRIKQELMKNSLINISTTKGVAKLSPRLKESLRNTEQSCSNTLKAKKDG